MKQEILMTLGVMAAIGAKDIQAAAPADKTKPNILLILTDDQGWGDLSCQGSEDLRTPNIDRLFEGGIRLDQFHASSNVSSPSRAGLLTGRYPIMVGVPGVIRGTNYTHGYLTPDAILLPQMLSKAGYKTAAIGKWHLGLQSPNLPNDRG
ncbi:MAG: sulfatase-like hydrolase/transferase, partial [Candidatus Cryptobacteroides sp.]